MKKIYLLMLFTVGLFLIKTEAQVSSYTFSQTNGTYTPITGGTVIASGNALDGQGYAVTLPTAFNFNGSSVTQVTAKVDGYLALGVSTFTSTTPISSTTAATGIIAALACDLQDSKEAGAVPEMSWLTVGNEIVFQWKDFRRYTLTAGVNERVSFQIRLNTVTSAINVVYDASTNVAATSTSVPQVGLRGLTNTDFNARRLTTTVPTATPNWANTAVATLNSHNVRYTSTAPAAVPAAGLTFTWTAASCFAPSALTVTNLTTSSATISWTAPSPAPASGYEYYLSTSSTTPTGAGTPNAGTSVNLASLPANTNHYFWVRSACGGTEFSGLIGPITFRTGYCSPSSTDPATYINNFSTTGGVANISNLASGYSTGGYQDNYSTMNATISAGNSLNFTLALVGGTVGAAVWLDLNKNLLFDAGERLYNTTSYTAGPLNSSIAIPVGTAPGEYRLRVLIHYNANNPADPCATNTRLEAEDYKLTVVPQPTDAMDYVNLQFPGTASIIAGNSVTVYTQGYEPGLTEPQGVAGAGITVWVGTNATNTDPATWAAGSWTAATFNAAQNPANNNDEYSAAIGAALSPGTHYYASRWQLNGGPFRYGGFSATGGGFWDGTTNVNGVLTVTGPAGDDPCDAITLTVDAANPVCVNTTPYTAVGDPAGVSACSAPNNTVWFKFTPTQSGPHVITASVPATSTNGLSGWLFLYTQTGTCPGTPAFTLAGGVSCTAGPSSAVAGTSTVINTTTLDAGTTYYLLLDGNSGDIGDACIKVSSPPACPAPVASAATSVSATTANANWTPTTGNFIIEYGPTATFTPVGTGATVGNANNFVVTASNVGTIQLTGLTSTTGYSYVVRQDCSGGGNGYSLNSSIITFTTTGAPPINDAAAGALELTVGATCTGAPYTNVNATQAANEKFASCYQSATTGTGATIATHTVWHKFVATGRAVKITTDIAGGTLSDTHLALFSATDVNDYGTFNIISCDDDNGVTGSVRSILYATGLAVGQTYYVSVDGYNSTIGTYCLTVENLTSSMLSTTNTCGTTGYQTPSGAQATYAGQVPIVDAAGNLIAIVRNPAGGQVASFTAAQNINTGAVRQSPSTGTYYLNRNYRIANTTATNVEVQFFFLASELAALTTADGTTLSSLAATRQVETVAGCQNNFVPANGAVSLLPQTSNGTSTDGLVNWIQVTTPAFSNFYLNNVGQVLPISIEYFRGTKQNTRNVLDWKVSCYNSPTVTLTLERSADGRRFEGISTTTETAARCLQPFNYADLAPLAGINYYRLKSIDADGKISYSDVVALLNKDKGFEIVGLAPNPVSDKALLSITSAERSIMEIVVSDVNGKQISKQRVSLIAGDNQVPLSLKNVAAGTYQVTGLTADGAVRTLRFVKQ